MRVKYKPWARPYLEEHQEVLIDLESLSKLEDFNMEIGSGKGGFISQIAKANPDKQYIAIEKNLSCSGDIAKHIVEEELHNVKLMNVDVSYVLDALKEGVVDNIYLNFSDPWPKKRHEKRRLTSEDFLKKYVKVLKVGGHIFFKTDNEELFEFSLKTFSNSSLTIIDKNDDYLGDAENDFETEYEKKKKAIGLKIHRLVLRKE